MNRARILTFTIASWIGVLVCLVTVYPQSGVKPAPGFADYGQWESLGLGAARGGLSPDGRWLAYGINRSNGTNELRIVKLADGATKTVAFGTQAAFSADSKWIAYSIGYSEADVAKAPPNAPLQNKLGMMNLGTGEMTSIDGIQSFALSPDGAFIVMRRYGPRPATPAASTPAAGRGGRGGDTSEPEEPVGTTVIVRQLSSGRDATFGNVGESAWRDTENTHLLAMTISAESKTGNGVHLFDPETAVLRVLDSSASVYKGLAWRKNFNDLAVFRARTDDTREGANELVMAWTGLGGAAERLRTYDAAMDSAFPQGLRVVSFRRLSWSDDGKTLFFGIANWNVKPPAAGRGAGRGGEAEKTPDDKPATPDNEAAAVDIWHWTDIMVQPRQKLSANGDRQRNMLAAWHVDTGKFVQLGKDPVNEQVSPVRHSNYALVTEWSKYAMDRTIGRPSSDLFIQDISTGLRTRLKDNVNDRYVQVSPGGKYVLFLENDHFWTIDLGTRAIVNITKGAPTSFVDKESDVTTKQKPSFGGVGWTKGDAAVLLYDKFDFWHVPADGSKATRLTAGAAEQVRHRLVRLDPQADDPAIDMTRPQYLSLFGLWSKKSGYARLQGSSSPNPGPAEVEKLVWLDKSVASLAKAKDAEVYAYISQDFDDSPDVYVGTADLSGAKQVTNTNPFQEKFAWGRSEIVEFTGEKGLKLQAALYYPAGYEPGKQYPMIVNLYERLSDNVHRYDSPSDRDYYNISVFTSSGYVVLQPDIVFSPRQPGVSVVQCVTAAIKRVTAMGVIDPKRVGAVGHSWGGFDTAYLATHTKGVFAAAVAGAPITNLVSNYGNHHWNSGIAETDHIETGQQRMEVPLWEDLQEYIANSAVFNAQNMTVPLLIEVGDNDGTVFWHQGVELFNIARRAGKNVVLLQYNGEDHGLRQKKNQTDYQRRILAWFAHYLKDEPAEKWITSGESYLDRQDAIKKQTGGK